jgi:hypothetical protein
LGIKKRELTKDIVKSSYSKSEYSSQKIKELLKMNFIPVQKTIDEMAQFYKQDLTEN